MPNLLPFLIVSTIWCGSFVCAALPFIFLNQFGTGATIASVAMFPAIFIVSFALIAGGVSRVAKKGIQRGKFPREAMHPVYLMRRIYGAAWTQLYYFKPVYAVVLAIPVLKKVVFWLYGFQGSTDFVVYPDTWIRDLPILNVGKGCYLSNRATLGTNLCLSNGRILVDAIRLSDKVLIGHLAKVAPGFRADASAEIGVDSSIGIRVRMGEHSNIKPVVTLNHGSVLGIRAEVGTRSYVGLKAKIGDGVAIPSGANVPDGSSFMTQAEWTQYYESETAMLEKQREFITSLVKKQIENAQPAA